jgi:protein-disulfide isomerase
MSLTVPVGKDDHIEGAADAPLTLLEYGDYECPHCGTAYLIVKALQHRFGARLRFVFRNMPLAQVHPHAQLAAEAAEAAGAQGQFWPMHDSLFENQQRLGAALIVDLARQLRLDVRRFEDDVDSHRFQARVRRDFMSAVRSGVAGTPGFFINAQRYDLPWDEQTLGAALQAALP